MDKVSNGEDEVNIYHQKTLVEIGFTQITAAQAVQLASTLNRRQQRIFEIWHQDRILARAMVARGCLQSNMREGRQHRAKIAARALNIAALHFSKTNRARSDSLYLFLQFKCAQCESISTPIKYTHYISGRSPRFECNHSWDDFTNRDQRKRFQNFEEACKEFNIEIGERVSIDSKGGHRYYLKRHSCQLCALDLTDCREASLLSGVKPRHRYSSGGLSYLCPKTDGIAKVNFAKTEHSIEVFPDIDSEIQRAAHLLATNSMDKVPVKYLNCGHSGAVWKLALLKSLKNTSIGCPDCSERYRHSARAAKILAQNSPTKQDLEWANKPAKVVVCVTRAITRDGAEHQFLKVGVTNGKRYNRSEVLLQHSTTQIAAYTIEQNIFSECPQIYGAALGMNLADLHNAGHSETASLDSYSLIEAAFRSAVSRWEQGDRTPAQNSYRIRATPLGVRSSGIDQQ
jgi:hypothetical protein